MDNCIFCKIVRGEIPSDKVYEDDEVLAFRDIRPQAPVHFMLIPKRHIDSLAHAENEAAVLGRMLALSGRLAREQGSPDGYRDDRQHRPHRPAGCHASAHTRHRRPEPAWPDDAQVGRRKGENMGSLSIWHWMIVLLVVVLIFGTKKLRNIGQDLGGAVKGFKEGMKAPEAEQPAPGSAPAQQIGGQTIEGEVKKEKTS